jgi:hypothetical protein
VSSVSNGLYLLTLPLVSVMRVIYTSKGMSKKFGCALYIRCALSIEKYGMSLYGYEPNSGFSYTVLTACFIMEKERVYCEVRSKSLSIIQINVIFSWLS